MMPGIRLHAASPLRPAQSVQPLSFKSAVGRRRATYARAASVETSHLVEGVTTDEVGTPMTLEEERRFNRSYKSNPFERAEFLATRVKGEIPKDLEGTYLRNGPGNFNIGDMRINHPFDGDGCISAYSFKDGEVLFRRKFVRTAAQKEEFEAGRLIYKGAFTVGDPSGGWSWPFNIQMRKSANIGVLRWAGKTLALYDRDLPHAMDDSLKTEGLTTLNVWDEKDSMGAHYRVMAERDGSKRLCAFGTSEAGQDLMVKMFELDEEGNKVAEETTRIPDAAFGFTHDFLVTENYYLIVENPTRMDYWKLLTKYALGKACIAECLYLDNERPFKIHCVPRPGKNGRERVVHEAKSKFAFHHVNAWEADEDTLVVDTLARQAIDFGVPADDPGLEPFNGADNCTTLRRMVFRGDKVEGEEFDFREVPRLGTKSFELPSHIPPASTGRKYGCMFAMGSRDMPDGCNGHGQCVTKIKFPHDIGVGAAWDPAAVDVSQYYTGDGRYCGEPQFVPKPGQHTDPDTPFDGSNGYIVVTVNDLRVPGKETTTIEILDSDNLEAGPLAVVDTGELSPPGLHGSWSDTYLGQMDGEQIPFRNDIRVNL